MAAAQATSLTNVALPSVPMAETKVPALPAPVIADPDAANGDANGDGVIDEAEGRKVAYKSWTPRLLRTAYNWKLVTADPGNYAHNPAYTLELLYDSIEDLAGPLGIDMASLNLLR